MVLANHYGERCTIFGKPTITRTSTQGQAVKEQQVRLERSHIDGRRDA